MRILVTGGAGYIGSHVVKQLLEETQHEVVVIDDLSTGSMNVIDRLQKIRPFLFSVMKVHRAGDLLSRLPADVVMHFAASISVPESVKDPCMYYLNNTVDSTLLFYQCQRAGVKKIIFSSTAAVYGSFGEEPVVENEPLQPTNPYGRSKMMTEQILKDICSAPGSEMRYVIFRYFNVAGSDMHFENDKLTPRFGHRETATHLIKMASEAACGKRQSLSIFGTDFDTKDGTGVRDYIHVEDIARAHLLGLTSGDGQTYNVGYGHGYSVREVIETVKRVSGRDFVVVEEQRREGDPGSVIADSNKIAQELGWQPKFDDLDLICRSAFLWEASL